MQFVKPLDEALLHQLFAKFNKIITLEDACIKGGFGSAILEFAQRHHYQKHRFGIGNSRSIY